MGARQSKRSVDITTTPKKEGLPVEGVVGDAAAPGDGKLEKIEETDAKPTTNGVAPHTDATPEDKYKDKDETTEKETEKENETKAEDAKVESPTTETPAEVATEATTPTEETPANAVAAATSPESKETKKKDKLKKKWSFRSISFGKKDKSKPAREETPKNGDVSKEEPLAEGSEEAETAEGSAGAASCPAEDKSSASSPTEKEQSGGSVEAIEGAPSEAAKPEQKKSPSKAAAAAAAAASPVASSPAEEKKDDNTTPAPTPVPTEANKSGDNEKEVEPAKAEKKVEVSHVMAVIDAPVEVSSLSKRKANTAIDAPSSIIERKTSEDIPSQFPSSPPPTPIDPSPLQRAQQVAANATALAEALKLPAEAANKAADAAASYASGQNLPGDANSFPSACRSTAPPLAPIFRLAEQSDISTVSVSHERTGDASSSSSSSSSSSPPQSSAVDDTEVPNLAASSTDINDEEGSSTRDNDDVLPVVVDCATALETEIAKVSSIASESSLPEENDLVVRTEEGPMPISGDTIVEARPAVVVPDRTIVDDEKIVEAPGRVEESHDDGESATRVNESSDASLVVVEETIDARPEFEEALAVPIVVASPTMDDNDDENDEKDVPPPLPDSPIPVPKVTSQLLNFISAQIEDTLVMTEIAEEPARAVVASDDLSRDAPLTNVEASEARDDVGEIVEARKSRFEEVAEASSYRPNEPVSRTTEDGTDRQLPQPPASPERSSVRRNSFESFVRAEAPMEYPREEHASFEPVAVAVSKSPMETEILASTPSLSCRPVSDDNDAANPRETSIGESASLLELGDDPSNREFKMESLEQSLNSYDSEVELKERLAESIGESQIVDCQLTYDVIEENDQNKTETEAPVENSVVPNDVGTTGVNDEAPMSPPPAVPAEAPAPVLGPAITEDVASVTKAIEEIDINEKAVAAAVNENIESVNTTEIIADMNHQNDMNE